MAVADIARTVGVRYQHARNVLLQAGMLTRVQSDPAPRVHAPASGGTASFETAREAASRAKPQLSPILLAQGSFVLSACWVRENEDLELDRPLPTHPGVYAFLRGEEVLYVGVATMGLAKRLRFYRKPGPTQTTSLRVKQLLLTELVTRDTIEIMTAAPGSTTWMGLPVDLNSGLEAALIKTFAPPWNKRGV